MFEDISLFGEESPAQIAQMIVENDSAVFNIRESALIPVVNRFQKAIEDEEIEDFTNEVFEELKALYLYGNGYHRETVDERKRRFSAYSRFAFELAKQGILSENFDLTRDAVF